VQVLAPSDRVLAGAVLVAWTPDSTITGSVWRSIWPDCDIVDVYGESGALAQVRPRHDVLAGDLYAAAANRGVQVVLAPSPVGELGWELGGWAEQFVEFASKNPVPGVVKKDVAGKSWQSTIGIVVFLVAAAAVIYLVMRR
jgi:hypothetical protein